jgi:hypothetical protein
MVAAVSQFPSWYAIIRSKCRPYTGGASCYTQAAKQRWNGTQVDLGGRQSKAVSPLTPSAAELRIAELKPLLGRKQVELDFFKRAFEQVRGAAA